MYLRDSGGDEGLNLVEQHRLVGELDERLGAGEGEGAEAGAVAADQDERLHVAQLRLCNVWLVVHLTAIEVGR